MSEWLTLTNYFKTEFISLNSREDNVDTGKKIQFKAQLYRNLLKKAVFPLPKCVLSLHF